MRTTVNLAEDALIAAKYVAQRDGVSLGEAISCLVRRGATLSEGPVRAQERRALKGRFALLPVRDEIITTEHVRDLMEREGI